MAVGTVYVFEVEHTITGGTWFCLVSRAEDSAPLELSRGDIVPLGPEDRYRIIEIQAEHEVTGEPGRDDTVEEALSAETNRLLAELDAAGKNAFQLEY